MAAFLLVDGGPKVLVADMPEEYGPGEWRFDAGEPRTAVPYGFLIGAAGEFGIHRNGRPRVALHESVEGWIESLALADHAGRWARQVTRLTGDQVEGLDLVGYQPVGSVRGLADTWWRGSGTLVAVYRGEALCMGFPPHRTALVCSGLEDHGLSALEQHHNQP